MGRGLGASWKYSIHHKWKHDIAHLSVLVFTECEKLRVIPKWAMSLGWWWCVPASSSVRIVAALVILISEGGVYVNVDRHRWALYTLCPIFLWTWNYSESETILKLKFVSAFQTMMWLFTLDIIMVFLLLLLYFLYLLLLKYEEKILNTKVAGVSVSAYYFHAVNYKWLLLWCMWSMNYNLQFLFCHLRWYYN